MSVGFFKVGQPVTISFAWWDSNDAPITATLTPTPTLTITEPDGTETVVELVKRGSTAYWDYALTPDAAGVWALQGYCADASVAVAYPDVIALWVTTNDLADIPALVWNYMVSGWGAVSTAGGWLKQALDTLLTRTSGGVTVVAPVNALTGNLEVIRGDDYTVSSGRALPAWVSDDWTPYDLSTATAIQFRAQPATGGTVFTKAVTALSDTEVRLELTDTETAAFSVGKDAYVFDIQATLLTGDIVTLVRGYMSVVRDVR